MAKRAIEKFGLTHVTCLMRIYRRKMNWSVSIHEPTPEQTARATFQLKEKLKKLFVTEKPRLLLLLLDISAGRLSPCMLLPFYCR